MLFAQCAKVRNPATNQVLPHNLVAEDPGISLINKSTDITMAAVKLELGVPITPVNHVQTAEIGNQSSSSLALIAARYTYTSNDVLIQMAAAYVIAVC